MTYFPPNSNSKLKNLYIAVLKIAFVGCFLLSCNTDLFEFDRLSLQTNLEPELRAPLASIEVELSSFLDDNDFDVDYQRDDYGTIFLLDTINRLLEIPFEDIYDPEDLSAEVDTLYALESIVIADASFDFDLIGIGDVTPFPDGSVIPATPFTASLVLGNIDIFNDPYSEVRFSNGTLLYTLTNNFPIDIYSVISLFDNNNQLISSSQRSFSAANSTINQSIDVSNLKIPKEVEVRLEIDSQGSTQPITIDYQSQTLLAKMDILDGTVDQIVLDEAKTFSYFFSFPFTLDKGSDSSIRQIFFDKNLLQFEVENEIGHPLDLSISSDQATIDGQPFALTYDILDSNQSQQFSDELINMLIDLTPDSTTGYSQYMLDFEINLNLQPGDVLEADREIRFSGSFDDIDLKHVLGNFGVMNKNVSDSIVIDDKLSRLYDKVKLVNPKLDFRAHNSFGIPMSFTANVLGTRKDGSQIEFSSLMQEQQILAASDLYAETTTSWAYDKSNSNIDEFISYVPDDKILLESNININSNPIGENFLHDESEFWVDIYAEVPVHVNINDLQLQDTLTLDSPVDTSEIDRILGASLYVNYSSELPFEVMLQANLIDTLSQKSLIELDPIHLKPAPVSNNGEVEIPVTGTMEISLTDTEIEDLDKVNAIPLEISVSTTDAANKDAKLSANALIKFGVEVELKVSVNE